MRFIGLPRYVLQRHFGSLAPPEMHGVSMKSLGFGNILHATLEPGASMKARIGSCIGRSSDMRVEPVLDGVLSAISRLMTGAPFFLERYTAQVDVPAELFLSPRGWDTTVIPLDGAQEFIVRGGSFLACSTAVRLSTTRLPREFLTDTGLFGLHARGVGLLALAGYGKLHRIELTSDEEYVFNRRNVVAWSDSVNIIPLNPMHRWSIFLGRNLFDKEKLTQALAAWSNRKARYCNLKGPGVVYMTAHVEHRPPLILRSKLANKASPEELDYQLVMDNISQQYYAEQQQQQQQQQQQTTFKLPASTNGGAPEKLPELTAIPLSGTADVSGSRVQQQQEEVAKQLGEKTQKEALDQHRTL
eukprot:ANDGO_04756.mRNA.1 hypothetical protein PTSG_03666